MLPGLPGHSSYNREDVEEVEALNIIMEEDMDEEFLFKVTRRANWLLESAEHAGLTQKQQIATRIQLVAAWLPQALQDEM